MSLKLTFRRIVCRVLGHEPKCYLPPNHQWWQRPGKGWCASCVRDVPVPPRFR